MKQNPLKDRVIAEKSVGFGMAKGKMVRVRAAEWGATDGLLSSTGTKPHFAQARRELNGLTDLHPRVAMSEFAPQSERWNPVPGSDGYKVRVAPSEDGDEECLSDNERLVAGGIAEAEIEQSLPATNSAAKKSL
jgi:hypothetical protein